MAAVGKFTQLVLECADPRQLSAFWQDVLDLGPAYGDDDWLTLDWAPVGRLSFHRVEGYVPPPWPGDTGESQVHFDLLVEDLARAAARVREAGARVLGDVRDPGPGEWQVFADPAGHPFCLVTIPV